MAHEDWDEIDGFTSPGEFQRFQRWINGAVEERALVGVPVAAPLQRVADVR